MEKTNLFDVGERVFHIGNPHLLGTITEFVWIEGTQMYVYHIQLEDIPGWAATMNMSNVWYQESMLALA